MAISIDEEVGIANSYALNVASGFIPIQPDLLLPTRSLIEPIRLGILRGVPFSSCKRIKFDQNGEELPCFDVPCLINLKNECCCNEVKEIPGR